jgi:uncharacterized membrane protein YdjX (TVP38/TMEM64 family)
MSEGRRTWLGVSTARWSALAAVAAGLVLLSVLVRDQLALEWSVASLRGLVERAGWWGPLLYIAILMFRFAVLVPSSILLIAAGLCFGAVPGTLYATVGLALSALLKYAVASIAGRDVLLRQLPRRLRERLALGDRRTSVGGLGLICAYPFGPKHVFQVAAILSGMSLVPYLIAVSAGANFRAAAFSLLGDSVATGEGIALVSTLLLLVTAAPLAFPASRRWLLA